MQKYTSDNPVFSDSIMEPSFGDRAHPDTFNPAYEQLLQNTLALKERIDILKEASHQSVLDIVAGTYDPEDEGGGDDPDAEEATDEDIKEITDNIWPE